MERTAALLMASAYIYDILRPIQKRIATSYEYFSDLMRKLLATGDYSALILRAVLHIHTAMLLLEQKQLL